MLFSAIGRKTHGPILKHFTIVNFAHENITISKFVSSVSALIGIPCSVELIPIGEIHNAVAMFNFCPPIENFGTDFPDFPTYLTPFSYLMVARLLDDWAKLLGLVNSKPIRIVSKSRRFIIAKFYAIYEPETFCHSY